MRRGELLGLRWVDVDLTSGRIAIRHLVMVDGKPAGRAKTAKGRRSLTLAPEVLDALRAHRAQQAAERLSWGAFTPTRAWSSLPRTVSHSIQNALGPVRPPGKHVGLPPIRPA